MIGFETRAAAPGAAALAFHDDAVDVPLDPLGNGHTLQVNHTSVDPATDPRVTYDGRTWHPRQLHVHSTSEHTLDGESFPFDDPPGPPGHRWRPRRRRRADRAGYGAPLHPHDPAGRPAARQPSFSHDDGSLTPPPRDEGRDGFVMAQPLYASARRRPPYSSTPHASNRAVVSSPAARLNRSRTYLQTDASVPS